MFNVTVRASVGGHQVHDFFKFAHGQVHYPLRFAKFC